MKSANQKIWVDFTDMLAWKGYFTGTQRVAYEIGYRLAETYPDVSFFAYDERSKNFYEISFTEISATIARAQEPAKPRQPGEKHKPSLVAVGKTQSLKAYQHLPYPIKKRITQEQKDQAKKLLHKLRAVHHKVQGNRLPILKSAIKASEPLHFKANEQVVILGKPWDTMSMIDALRAQKLESPFTFVHLIYDMIPVFLPHVFGQPLPANYTTHMFEAISLADQLVAISESTKRDIQKFCKEELLPEPPITVTKLGDGFVGATVTEDYHAVPGLKPEEYILCVGTLEIRKNHILLYTAYKEALSQGKTMPKLVIVGGRGWYVEDVLYEFNHDPELKDLVKIMHKVDDQQLAWLYQNCKFTVYPSVYEGWGLPIAESLAYGKVCIASKASSMPEVAGDLIDYFSPYNPAQCADLIDKYLDPATLANKQAEVQKRYKPASWDQTFEQFVKVLS